MLSVISVCSCDICVTVSENTESVINIRSNHGFHLATLCKRSRVPLHCCAHHKCNHKRSHCFSYPWYVPWCLILGIMRRLTDDVGWLKTIDQVLGMYFVLVTVPGAVLFSLHRSFDIECIVCAGSITLVPTIPSSMRAFSTSSTGLSSRWMFAPPSTSLARVIVGSRFMSNYPYLTHLISLFCHSLQSRGAENSLFTAADRFRFSCTASSGSSRLQF